MIIIIAAISYDTRDMVPEESATELVAPSPTPVAEGKPSIAVLPFDNLSRNPDQEYFADGIAEDILSRLSRFSDLKVIARNSTFQYKGSPSGCLFIARGFSKARLM